MELWIRSQDKKHLIKAEAIMYEITGPGFGIRVFTKNYDFNIACYLTKERALEVLDEIQNLLMPKIIVTDDKKQMINSNGVIYSIDIIKNINTDIQELSTYVYEMPEE